jgi:hypothetical protein
MKTTILLLFLVLASCSKDDSEPTFSLPPETQVGANTFGVTINNKVYIPRDPTGINWSGQQGKGMKLSGYYENGFNFTEIIIVDGASSVGFKMVIHIENLSAVGDYILKQSNFQDQIDSISENHIYFKIWDSKISNYAYYGSIEDQGILHLKRHNNGIISGNFVGKFVRYDNPNEFIQITDGRFDINSFTLQNTPFP